MRLRSVIATSIFIALFWTALVADDKSQILAKAAQLFGAPLSREHAVFQFNTSYVLWFTFDTQGRLLGMTLQPISDEHSGLLNLKAPSEAARMSETEYSAAVQRLSELKDFGMLLESHGSVTSPGYIGSFNTDRFERAYVERILTDDAQAVRRLDVHLLQEAAGPSTQLSTINSIPVVCFGSEWYYLSPDEAKKVKIGVWQTLQAAGPNLYSGPCSRTTVLHDADGFIIENPPNETILLDDIHVRHMAGRVQLPGGDEPLEGVNVELRAEGTKTVLRVTTGPRGTFTVSGLPEGKYKFKVTKDGFKSLSGFVFLDHKAHAKGMSFELPVGT